MLEPYHSRRWQMKPNAPECSTLEIRTMRCFGFVDCVNDFVSENRDFVRCGLQTTLTTQGTYFKKYRPNMIVRCRPRVQ